MGKPEVILGEGDINSVCPECHEASCLCAEDEVILHDDQAEELASYLAEQASDAQAQKENARFYEWEQTGISFWITLTVEDMLKLLKRDDSRTMMDDETLSCILLKLPGVRQVEYSGHFGAGIGISVDKEDFPSDGQRIVDQHIHDYLDREWGELVN